MKLNLSLLKDILKDMFSLPPRFDSETEWREATNQVVRRFARGNISVQQGRILNKEDQEREREEAIKIAKKWEKRRVTAAR